MFDEPDEVRGTPPYATLTSLVPQWSVSSRVTVITTTRLGGVSKPPFNALNLGLHVDDDPVDVVENRRRVADSFALPDSPCWLNQTHSADVVELIHPSESHPPTSADGAWTASPNIVLSVLTADCLPVVISNVEGTQLAVVHAGWRGLASGILANALSAFSDSAELHAWLGPAIGPTMFEVGEDVLAAFADRDPNHKTAFKPGKDEGKYLADLYALARAELNSQRPVSVSGGNYCTYTQGNLFHSYRRDGKASGRMATIAWISEA